MTFELGRLVFLRLLPRFFCWKLSLGDIMVRGGSVDSSGDGAAGGAAPPSLILVHFYICSGGEIQPLFGTAFTNRRLCLRNNIVGLKSFRAGKIPFKV